MAIKLKKQTSGSVSNPAATHLAFFVDETGAPKLKDDSGTVLGFEADLHSSSHITGAGDEIDGDQLDIDFTPSNYTPDITPGEVTSVDHLSAHLAGVDNALAIADLTVLEHVYISQANGSDSNSGVDGANALATLNAHLALYPEPPKTGRVFHFDSGSHTVPALPKGWGLYAPIIYIGDGADQPSDDGFTEVNASEASQGSTTTAVIEATGGVSSANIDQYVEILSGAATGARRMIHDVSGNIITLNTEITGLVAGDDYRIVTSATTLDYSATNSPVVTSIGSPIKGLTTPSTPFFGLINVNLEPNYDSDFADSLVVSYGVTYNTEGCHIANSTLLMGFTWYNTFAEAIAPYIAQIDASVPQTTSDLDTLWKGWGSNNLEDFPNPLGSGDIVGYYAAPDGGALWVGSDGNYTYPGRAHLRTIRCGVHAYPDGSIIVKPDTGDAPPIVTDSSGIPIVARGSGYIDISRQGIAGTWTASADVTVRAESGGTILLGQGTFNSTSNVAVVADVGHVIISSVFPVVTGSTPGTNDISADALATSSGFATIAASGAFIQHGIGTVQRE